MHRTPVAPSSIPPPLTAAAYGAGQLARIGWFLGQYAATRRWLARVEGWRRPGGRLVVVDSIQLGDAPALDGLLRGFPEQFHEPYYAGWIAADVPALLAEAGLTPAGSEIAYLSKVFVADRPPSIIGAMAGSVLRYDEPFAAVEPGTVDASR